jgi:hypothetical protein
MQIYANILNKQSRAGGGSSAWRLGVRLKETHRKK